MPEPVDRLCSRIESYYRTYYAAVAEHGQQVLDKLPSFVRGPHRLLVLVCRDGLGVVGYPAQDFEIKCMHLPGQRLDSAMNEHVSWMAWELNGKFGFHIGGTRLIRHSPGDPLTLRPDWDRAFVTSNKAPGQFTAQNASREAHHDVASVLAAELMSLRPDEVHEAPAKLKKVLEAFEELLNAEPSEEAVQQYLTENPVLLDPTALSVKAKHRLGSEYVTDFVVQRSQGDYELVEIEPPSMRLFNANGDPSARLSHAQKQVEDWREWVAENVSYARQSMPDVTEPRGRVVMGRRSHLTQQTERALRRRNQELHHLTVETFDDLIRRLRQTVKNISR